MGCRHKSEWGLGGQNCGLAVVNARSFAIADLQTPGRQMPLRPAAGTTTQRHLLLLQYLL